MPGVFSQAASNSLHRFNGILVLTDSVSFLFFSISCHIVDSEIIANARKTKEELKSCTVSFVYAVGFECFDKLQD